MVSHPRVTDTLDRAQAEFAAHRARAPVEWDPDLGAWAIYGWPEVRRVLSDWETFSSDQPQPGLRPSLLRLDPPRHTRLRALVAKDFTPRAVGLLEPRIRAIAQRLIADARGRDTFDFATDFAWPLPVAVITELLGIPDGDRDRFRAWADDIIGDRGNRPLLGEPPTAEALRARDEMDAYFREVCARGGHDHDLIGSLLEARVDGEALEEAELLSFCTLLLLAGHITTVNLLTNAIWCLLPEHLAELRAEPARVPAAVEEVLRYMSPVQGLSRVATRRTLINGIEIKAGERVVAWIASANRDERAFPDPERFDPRRQPNPHLSFGVGIHFCLGAPLSRLEARVALEELTQALPDLRVSEDDSPELRAGVLMGFTRLPVAAHP